MTSSLHSLPNIAALVLDAPLAIAPRKLSAILAALGPRVGLDAGAISAHGLPFEEPSRPGGASADGGIAVIPVVGSLVARVMGVQAMSGLQSYQSLSTQIDDALYDPEVKGILLDVDSYGGEVQGLFDLADKVRACRGLKPVYAVANGNAYSAAYAIASAAERVYLPRAAGVGSIGVVAAHVDQSGKDAKEGISVTFVHAGARKVDGHGHAPLGETARTSLQAQVDSLRELFVESIGLDGRITANEARATEAATFHGADAVAAGLADELGTFEDAMNALAARIDAESNQSPFAQRSSRGSRTNLGAEMANKKTEATAEGPSWEQRVEALEAEGKQAQAKIMGLEAQLEGATAALKAHKEAEAARADKAFAAFLDGVKADACAAGSPISEDDLAQVEAARAAGSPDLAKTLAGAFLTRSQALGGGNVRGDATKLITPTGKSGEDTKTAADYKAETEARWARKG